MEVIKPYADSAGKKEQVRRMFNSISGSYDFLNHLLSFGIDRSWRRKSVNLLAEYKPRVMLDVATGTGDFAIECAKLLPQKVTGIDISEKMLEIGRRKIKSRNLTGIINLETGDSENLAFGDNTFDAITVGFGVRNFENLMKGMNEMHRVLKSGGHLVVLEFSKPGAFPVAQLYRLYFRHLLPFIGSLISGDRKAYRYLHDSVSTFPEGEKFRDLMISCGFGETKIVPLMGGIASIYIGKK